MQLITNVNPWGADQAGGLGTLREIQRQQELDAQKRAEQEQLMRMRSQDMEQQQMKMGEMQRLSDVRKGLSGAIEGINAQEGLSAFDKQRQIEEAQLKHDPLQEILKQGAIDVTAPAMRAEGRKLQGYSLGAITINPLLAKGAKEEDVLNSPQVLQLAQRTGLSPQDMLAYAKNSKPLGPDSFMHVDPTSRIAHITTLTKDGQLESKVLELKPSAQWQDLGTQRIGRQLVNVQQNTATGEKKLTKMSPDIAIIGGGSGSQDAPIPAAIEKRLSTAYSTAQLANSLSSGYRPEYSAVKEWFGVKTPKTVAAAAQAAQKQFGENSPAALFWMDYQNYVNSVRKELFGTALSKHEQASFDAAIINPGMSPDTIKKSLDKQAGLVTEAYERTRSGQVFGKQKRAVETAYPSATTSGRTPKPPTAPSSAVVERRKTADGRILEKLSDGTIREAR